MAESVATPPAEPDDETTTQQSTDINAVFEPPWAWDDLGMTLHDSPTGVVLDHIGKPGSLSQPGLGSYHQGCF